MFFCSTEIHMLSSIHSHTAAYNTDWKGTYCSGHLLAVQFPWDIPVILQALATPLTLLTLPSAAWTPLHPTSSQHLWDSVDFRLKEKRMYGCKVPVFLPIQNNCVCDCAVQDLPYTMSPSPAPILCFEGRLIFPHTFNLRLQPAFWKLSGSSSGITLGYNSWRPAVLDGQHLKRKQK